MAAVRHNVAIQLTPPVADAGGDAAFADRVRRGETGAFEELFRAYYALLCQFAYGLLRSRVEAEEVVSDLLCDLWTERDRWTIQTSVRAYLFAATRNRVLRHLEQRRRMDEREPDVAIPAPRASGMDPAEHQALQAALSSAIGELPERCRQTYLLRAVHGLSYAEIAGTMGTTVKTVEMQLWKALKQLRVSLAAWYE